MSTAFTNQIELRLVNGGVAVIDECDADAVAHDEWMWFRQSNNEVKYAQSVTGKCRHLHTVIAIAMGLPERSRKLQIDHKDGDGLNNSRSNLRIATPQQNRANATKRKAATSRFKGVSFHRGTGKWQARIRVNGRLLWLGTFEDDGIAAAVYDAAAQRYFGEFARLNMSR